MKKKLLIISISILAVLIAVGLSYAYFNAKVTNSENTSTIISNSGTLSITLDGGNTLNAGELIPDSEAWATKTFTVTGNNSSSGNMPYSVKIVVDNNTFSTDAITYSLIGNNTGNNGDVIKDITNDPINSTKIIGSGYFNKGNNLVHTYTLKMYFLDTFTDQSEDMRAKFSAHIEIVGDKSYGAQDDRALATYTLLKNKTYSNQDGVWYFDENGNLDYGDNTKINLNIADDVKPKGVVSIWNNKLIYACLNYSSYNYEYDLTKSTIETRTIPCITDRYQNLVINGDLEYKSNMNLTEFGTYNSEGYLRKTSSNILSLFGLTYIPIDSNKKYEIGLDAKSNNNSARFYIGFAEYDADLINISAESVGYISNTLTELTENLEPNDTLIHVADLTNWKENLTGYSTGIIIWNYVDSTGYQYPELTYSNYKYPYLYDNSQNVDKVNNIIHFKEGKIWSGPVIPSGTKISQTLAGNSYNFSIRINQAISTDWTTYKSNIITGINNSGTVKNSMFRAGAKFIKIFMYFNYNSTANTTVDFKNIYIREIPDNS